MRVLYNLPFGLALSFAIYELGWQRLNFGDFSVIYAAVLKWSLISGVAFAFAWSPVRADE